MDRLRQTLDRLCLAPAEDKPVSGMGRPDPTGPVRLFKDGAKTVVQRLDHILFITRENRRTVIYHIDGRLEVSDSLNTLERELGGYPFLRTHRGYIVNLEMVREVIPISRWTCQIVMAHTTEKPLMTRN